ncbi:MAG: heterodisulfide reductase-related iron-sulfur binding cluster [Clostridiales bacterium]|nr:heterodisulfide reductase-related iron-sulfur binding cluster [Clostridiales bacterium]
MLVAFQGFPAPPGGKKTGRVMESVFVLGYKCLIPCGAAALVRRTDMEEAKKRIKACWEKEEPFCASSCPFHYDIREFTARLKRGSFNSAFRTFANGVGFPAIVAALCDCSCRTVCPRQGSDAAIDMQQLERSALDYAVNTKPNSYNLPPKAAKIAIIGAGLSGLACALRLCNKKYQVTVFEESEQVGGKLWNYLPPDLFLADIKKQFMYEEYTLHLNTKITDAAALLDEYQAVYVATGINGAGFGLLDGLDRAQLVAPYASHLPGVFLGGSLLGATDMDALAQGLQVANLIEAYLKTGNMKGAKPHKPTNMQLASDALSYLEPVIAEQPFTKEQAIAEAQRCLGCRCDACYRHCPLMNYFEKFPLRIADEVAVTIDPGTLDGNGTVATRLIATCSQCGLCAEVCPQQIDVGDFLRKSHQVMQTKEAMPWAFHDFWLRDMADARSENSSFLGSPNWQPPYIFFPGCQLGASEPRYVLGVYKLLHEADPDTAIWLGCCGAPAVWAGDMPLSEEVNREIKAVWESYNKPLVILACPTCREIFAQYLPEIETVFLLDHFAKRDIKPSPAANGEKIAIFDPCAMRQWEKSRQNVRDLAQEAGFAVQELPYHGTRAQCCSFGGQMDTANPPYKEWLVKQRIQASSLPYLVYCSNCRDIFAKDGKEAIHALELYNGCMRETEQTPGIEQRLLNRHKVKEEIIKRYFPQQAEELLPAAALPVLHLAPGLAEKLDRERIFLADITAVIAASEKERYRLRKASGHYVGHQEIGYMTYWVEYLPEDDGYSVFNAYAHRMKITP